MRRYYAAFFFSAWLRRMMAYAVVLYGLEALGSGEWSGVLYVALLAPYLLSVYAGAVVDAVSKTAVLIAAASTSVALLFLLAGSTTLGRSGAALAAMAIIAVYGAVSAFSYPAFLSAVAEEAPPSEAAHAMSLIAVLSMVCQICGPVAIGALHAGLSWSGVFMVLGGVAVVGLGLVCRLPPSKRTATPASSKSVAANTWQWCRILPSQHPALLALLVAVTVFSVAAVGPLELFVPLYGAELEPGQPFRSGLFMATGGLGLLTGALWALRLVRRPRVGAWLCASSVIGGVLLIALTYASAALAFTLLFAAGITGGLFNSLCLAGIQARAPAALRGRVLGLYTLILGGSPAIGGFVAGKLLHHVSVPVAMRAVFGAAVALFFALYFVLPGLRSRASAAAAE